MTTENHPKRPVGVLNSFCNQLYNVPFIVKPTKNESISPEHLVLPAISVILCALLYAFFYYNKNSRQNYSSKKKFQKKNKKFGNKKKTKLSVNNNILLPVYLRLFLIFTIISLFSFLVIFIEFVTDKNCYNGKWWLSISCSIAWSSKRFFEIFIILLICQKSSGKYAFIRAFIISFFIFILLFILYSMVFFSSHLKNKMIQIKYLINIQI